MACCRSSKILPSTSELAAKLLVLGRKDWKAKRIYPFFMGSLRAGSVTASIFTA